jgi:hypothetical protein
MLTHLPVALALLAPAAESANDADAFVAEIAQTHNASAYYTQPAIKADVLVEFGGQVRHDGPMWFVPAAHKTRLESGDQTIVFDGSTCFVTPAAEADPGDRFAALTWPYFLAAPFKLQDEGSQVADGGEQKLDGTAEPTVRMTFGENVGDAPDDWYLIWKDDAGRLEALAYIVTYFPGREPSPSVAMYDEFMDVDGVAMPKSISFYNWSEADGITGEAKGRVEVRSLEFVEAPEKAFEAPADSVEVELPRG